MKYREAERLLLDHAFVLTRQDGSHRRYEGFVGGKRRLVTLAPHSWNDDINKDVLAFIRRQSGLPKRLFR